MGGDVGFLAGGKPLGGCVGEGGLFEGEDGAGDDEGRRRRGGKEEEEGWRPGDGPRRWDPNGGAAEGGDGEGEGAAEGKFVWDGEEDEGAYFDD